MHLSYTGGMPATLLRALVLIRRNPSAGLLLVQLAGLLLYPLMQGTDTGRLLFNGFGLVVLGLALWVVRRSPWANWIGGLLALCIVALGFARMSEPSATLTLLTSLAEAAFYAYAAGSLIAYMLSDETATTDEMFAAGATFTLLAWSFAHLYMACQSLNPAAFGALANPGEARPWFELLFLSITTLSGVGLGDIIPLSPMARGIVMLEEFTGVMYIALVVSRLVGLTIAARK